MGIGDSVSAVKPKPKFGWYGQDSQASTLSKTDFAIGDRVYHYADPNRNPGTIEESLPPYGSSVGLYAGCPRWMVNWDGVGRIDYVEAVLRHF